MKTSAQLRAAWDAAQSRPVDSRRSVIDEVQSTFNSLKARNAELLAKDEMLASEKREFESNVDELTKLSAILDEVAPTDEARRLAGVFSASAGGAHARAERAQSGPFAQAVADTGFDYRHNRSVVIDDALGALRASTFDDPDHWRPSRPGITPLGQDRRFLWSNLITLPAEHSAIEDFRQTARTLTGNVERALDAETLKASLANDYVLVNEPLVEFAVTIDDIPNAVLEFAPLFRQFLENDARFMIDSAIDEHVMTKILAATPPNELTGTGLIAQVRNGIAAHRAEGANPTLLVVNPTDAAALDLSTDDGGLVFPTSSTGTSSPLWGQRIIERAGNGDESPLLIDRGMLGALYIGSMRIDADPYSGFKRNLTTLRFEIKGLMHVRNPKGALLIEADPQG